MTDLSPGQVIALTDGRQATVRFAGSTHFAAGDWIGIELDDATGKNDGSVQGERYFDCEPGCGMFVRPPAIAAIVDKPARESKAPAKTTASTPSRGRAQSGIAGGGTGLKKPGSLPPTVKRNSASAASPSPAPKVTSQRTSLRVCLRGSKQWPLLSTNFTLCEVSYEIANEAALNYLLERFVSQWHFATVSSNAQAAPIGGC